MSDYEVITKEEVQTILNMFALRITPELNGDCPCYDDLVFYRFNDFNNSMMKVIGVHIRSCEDCLLDIREMLQMGLA